MPGCELDACFLAVSEESAECAFVAGVDAFGFDELVVSAHDVGDDGFRGCHGSVNFFVWMKHNFAKPFTTFS